MQNLPVVSEHFCAALVRARYRPRHVVPRLTLRLYSVKRVWTTKTNCTEELWTAQKAKAGLSPFNTSFSRNTVYRSYSSWKQYNWNARTPCCIINDIRHFGSTSFPRNVIHLVSVLQRRNGPTKFWAPARSTIGSRTRGPWASGQREFSESQSCCSTLTKCMT